MEINYHWVEPSAGVSTKRKHSPSPVFDKLAQHYEFPYTYEEWSVSGNGAVEYKKRVKSHIISRINESVERYVKGLPFLRLDLSEGVEKQKYHELKFDDDLQNFLNERNVRQVFSHYGQTSYIIPLSAEQFTNRAREKLILQGGFEIRLAYASTRRMLYDFAHEIAHTFFYDISSDAPTCMVSDQTLKIQQWYQEFEGLAFDFGREIWLPRKAFTDYVKCNHSKPSMENFLKMYSELCVGVDPLAQRLLHDLKLWKALMFWGTVHRRTQGSNENIYSIFVGNRGRRRNGFDRISLNSELVSQQSELRHTIIQQINSGDRLGKTSISLNGKKYSLDTSIDELHSKENNFIAMLYQN